MSKRQIKKANQKAKAEAEAQAAAEGLGTREEPEKGKRGKKGGARAAASVTSQLICGRTPATGVKAVAIKGRQEEEKRI